jgi:hypothetical protein
MIEHSWSPDLSGDCSTSWSVTVMPQKDDPIFRPNAPSAPEAIPEFGDIIWEGWQNHTPPDQVVNQCKSRGAKHVDDAFVKARYAEMDGYRERWFKQIATHFSNELGAEEK